MRHVEPILVSLDHDPAPEEIGERWAALERAAQPSFFLSWAWVGCWLRATAVRPDVLVARRGSQIIGLALLVRAASHIWPFPTAHLTSSGDAELDSPFIEYNGFLATKDEAAEVASAFMAFLGDCRSCGWAPGAWSRLCLPGIDAVTLDMLKGSGLAVRVETSRGSPYVDLEQVRRTGGGYLDSRSRNSRQAIRRSLRLFEERGQLRLTAAGSVAEALAILDELKGLHQAYWRAKGRPGAFASPFFDKFHRSLVAATWPAGHIDLLRLTAGGATIGCLYNFIYGGQAYSYQSGFDYGFDARHKPGLVSHALAVERYLSLGLERYRLLAGDARYKASLATGADTLHWVELRRRGGLGAAAALAPAIMRRLGMAGSREKPQAAAEENPA